MNAPLLRCSMFLAALLLAPLAASAQAGGPTTGAGAGSRTARPDILKEPPVFDEKAVAIDDITSATARAAERRQRVLVVWGANSSRWSRYMHRCIVKNQETRGVVRGEYQVVFVDTAGGKRNMDAAAAFGADLATHGIPYLTVIDPAAGVIASRETDDLKNPNQSMNPGYNGADVAKVLREHQNPPEDAHAVLNAATTRAKTENKRVLLVARETVCSWCDRWDDWLREPANKSRLEKDLVVCVIDAGRMTGGAEVLQQAAGGMFDATPFFLLLEPDGAPLATSMMPRPKEDGGARNIGFPQAPDELAHFAGVLKKAQRAMTDEDIAALVASMRPK